MLLKNKKILITGLANKFSIAAGIADAMHREGAELAFTYQNERLLKNIKPLANEYDSDILIECDVSNDESLILYSPSNSLYEYSYPGDPQTFIIKNLYQYDTLNIQGHNARFTSNGDIISFTTHSFDYYDFYNNDNNSGLSSIQTYSRSGDSVTVLSDSIFYGFYILSDDKNRILWLEKVSSCLLYTSPSPRD